MSNQANTILDGGLVAKLRGDIEDIFRVDAVHIPKDAPQGTLVFTGQLIMPDSEVAYDLIAERWRTHQYTPALREEEGVIVLTAEVGLIETKPSDPRINLLFFILTVISMMLVGSLNEEANLSENPSEILLGLPFTLSFLAILLAHEFGHYFAARYHKVDVTLPYFIPFPTIWGTLGAFIQLRSPTKNRDQLFDIGVSGPLAGLIVTIPILIIGLLNSPVQPLPVNEPYWIEGNSIAYWSLKQIIFGQPLPSDGLDVLLGPLAMAGWSGFFITMLNLIPVGQLDGGHIIYVLLGRKSYRFGQVTVAIMVLLALFFWLFEIGAWLNWLMWAGLITLFIGAGHPPPLNDLVPLSQKRKWLGYFVVVIFILIFMPIPITVVNAS